MHDLLRAVEPQQPQRGLDGGLDRARPALVLQQAGQRFHGQLPQAFPLPADPVLERHLVDVEILQELAAIERRGLFQ